MRNGKRRVNEDLPTFDALEPTPAGGRDAGIRTAPSRLGPARGAGLAAAAIALLVVGIAVGSFSLQGDPSDSAGPSSGAAKPSGSPGIEACRSPQPGEFPTLYLGAEGRAQAVRATFRWGAEFGQKPGAPDWTAPPSSHALAVAAGSNLVLGTSSELVVGVNSNVTAADPSLKVRLVLHTCFQHLEVWYRAIRSSSTADPGMTHVNMDVEPVTGRVVLDGLPAGDWMVWVTATFETFARIPTTVITGSSFRVLSGEGPFASDLSESDPPASELPTRSPGQTPLATPAFPCGTSAATPDLPIRMFVGPDLERPGILGLAVEPTEVHVRQGEPLVIRVEGNVCAVGWQIIRQDRVGQAKGGEYVSNPTEDPDVAAQNRWVIPASTELDPAFGNLDTVTADLHFSGGLEIIRSWNVIVDLFEVPALYVVGPDGARFEAAAGCDLSLELSNGYQSSAQCSAIGYTPGNQVLYVQAYQPVHVDLPGWDITGWGAACGRVTGNPEQFESPDGCGLGSGNSEASLPLTDRPAFVLPPGDTILQVFITAIDGAGDRFSATYYARVIAR